MSSAPDIIIVGAGIVGAACARQCANSGLKTVVLEQGDLAGGSTAACMGHLVITDDSPAQFDLCRYSRDLWHQIAPELPKQADYWRCGTIWVAADEEEMGEVRRKYEMFRRQGMAAEILDRQALLEAEPFLRADLAGGLLVPDDGVVYAPAAANHWLKRAADQSAQIRAHTPVRALLESGGVELADGSRLSAGLVIVAAGCWMPQLLPGTPIRRRKGHLVVTDRYPGYVRHQLVELGYLKSAHSIAGDSVAFNIHPRQTGQLIIGSSRQYSSEDTAIDRGLLGRMLSRARDYMPTLENLLALRAWTGFRPATPDKLPLIGPSLVSDKLWLAAGHEGLGITTSLATARLIDDTIHNRATAIPLEPYHPCRYALQEAGHG